MAASNVSVASLLIEDDVRIRKLLKQVRTIAVVGASTKPWRDSYQIAQFLIDRGYKVFPVNPSYEDVLGLKCYPDLLSVPERIDLVDIFRRPEAVGEIVQQAIAVNAGAIWMQLGVSNEEAAKLAADAGIQVVMDRCIALDYRRLMH
ncbi:MAG TPA: CoA-binding protein [Bacteroidota bacterium]|nr:CoA-binding protein [Bacteroidota bacterium]